MRRRSRNHRASAPTLDPVLSPCSVVVPVYRSTSTLGVLVDRIDAVFGDVAHEILLVDDGSPAETWVIVEALATENRHVRGIRLGRNFGQHSALVAGIRHAQYPTTITMDDDLQNPPEEIPLLLAGLVDDFDVVYGTSKRASHDRWRNMTSKLSKWALASVLGADNAANMSTFRAFRTDLRAAFDTPLGPSVSVDALLSWGTSRFTAVEVRHDERSDGASNYSVRRLVRYALDIATGYSSLPLQLAMGLGFLTAFFGVIVLGWVVVGVVVNGGGVPGFPFLASTMAIFAGAQLLALGVLGEYLARIHFRVMQKPTYVIARDTAPSADEPG